MTNFCHMGSDFKITAIDWYNGSGGLLQSDIPCLAICFDDGKVQILRHQRDEIPVRFEVQMTKIKMAWNPNGSILAIAGMQIITAKDGDEKESCIVQFWSPFGEVRFKLFYYLFLRSIRIPGKVLSSISWENDGLRLAIAVDSFIYFANIRPDYRWAYFAKDVLVYAFNRPDTSMTDLTFWNVKSNETYTKSIEHLIAITAAGDHCVVTTKMMDGSGMY
jgi:WD repeat-containing protein 35